VALPVLSGRKTIRALLKAGFIVEGKKVSHVKLKKRVDGRGFVVIVPGLTIVSWQGELCGQFLGKQTLLEKSF
jgi:predicted RNA binding protein YcfA (HicA-like mRNA interferase family)